MKKVKKKMAKEQEKVDQQGNSSPEHALKLLGRVGTELNGSFFDVNSRKVMREMLESLPEFLDKMDERDEKFQMLPENRIPELKKEIASNDEILRRNHENKEDQIQIGLYQRKWILPGSPRHDQVIEKTKLDIEDVQIRIDSKIELACPIFKYQENARWREIQLLLHKRNIKALRENLEATEKSVNEVKEDIAKQNQEIKLRRIQIIEELKKLKVDVTEYSGKVPDYIQ